MSLKEERKNKYDIISYFVLKDCESEGIEVEKSYKGTFNISLNPGLYKKAAQIAMIKGLTLNQFVQRAIKREVETESE